MTMKTRPTTRLTNLSLGVVALLALCGSALRATSDAPDCCPLGRYHRYSVFGFRIATSSSASQINERSSLTAAQIISILQQKPELVVELKSLVADQLATTGRTRHRPTRSRTRCSSARSRPTPHLRSSITIWLRARGYVSAADMDRLLSSSAAEDEERSPLSSASHRVGRLLDSLSLSASRPCPKRTGFRDGPTVSGRQRHLSSPHKRIDSLHGARRKDNRQALAERHGRTRIPCICQRHTICVPCVTSTPRCLRIA